MAIAIRSGRRASTTARRVLDVLVPSREALVHAQAELREADDLLAYQKSLVVSHLIAVAGDAGIGKTEADKDRKIAEALFSDDVYQRTLAHYRQAQTAVALHTAEIASYSDMLSVARMTTRERFTSALLKNGVTDADLT